MAKKGKGNSPNFATKMNYMNLITRSTGIINTDCNGSSVPKEMVIA